jgi:sulfate permease, SulP family
MTNTKFNQRQEVMALSFANFFAGFFGGMPGTAALVRTALNIKSGATSRLSGIICSVTVTVLALLLLPYFKFLPLPNIASIVVLAALQMIDVEELQLVYTSTVPYLRDPFHPPLLSAPSPSPPFSVVESCDLRVLPHPV